MKNISKSTKVIIFLIVLVIGIMIGLVLLEYSGFFNNIKINNSEEKKIELNERFDYEIGENGVYKIYDKDGILIDEIYDEVEFTMYKMNPDYMRTTSPITYDGEDLILEESNE